MALFIADLAFGAGTNLNAAKVAILAASEFVNPKIPSTVDAANLSKMAERGQIRGALVDGPLALDNAISEEAARVKGKVVNRLVLPEGLSVEFVNREAGEYLNDGDMFKVANYSFKFMAPQD